MNRLVESPDPASVTDTRDETARMGGKARISPLPPHSPSPGPRTMTHAPDAASWEMPEGNAEAAAALTRARAEAATAVHRAQRPPTVTALADDVARVSVDDAKENERRNDAKTVSPLEALMTAKANGVATAHRALLALASPAAFARAPEQATVAAGATTAAKPTDNAGRVRATKELYAESQRREAARRRERARTAERARETSKLCAAAVDAEVAAAAATQPAPAAEERARMEAEAARAAEAERRGAEKAEEAKRASEAVKAVEALQETVKRRLARKGISLPPLCGCPHARTAKPFAMDHVYKCARNCPLRGDEVAYRAALAQMLAAHDIVVTPPPLPV